MPRHLRSLLDLTAAELDRVVSLAALVKRHPDRYRGKLAGKSIAMIFTFFGSERPSFSPNLKAARKEIS